MEFQNRQGSNLNRRKLTIISQTPNEIIADIERADTVSEEGTPLNAETFNAWQEIVNRAQGILNNIYPIGSVYISAVDGVTPAALFGGEWEQITNAFLFASSDLTLADALRKYKIGTFGGEEQHVLTEAEMPIHSHMSSYTSSGDVGDRIGLRLNSMSWGSDLASYDYGQIAGGGEAHNNMPPYITVNIWWRRA